MPAAKSMTCQPDLFGLGLMSREGLDTYKKIFIPTCKVSQPLNHDAICAETSLGNSISFTHQRIVLWSTIAYMKKVL